MISETARREITDHIATAERDGRLLKQIDARKTGNFVGPAVIKMQGIGDLDSEVFGPVLHVATFTVNRLDEVIEDINAKGFGLTFGLHTRVDDRVKQITSQLNVGNMYINRNQIGAIVGSQPFGGEGLSGTGPKAGRPNYVPRFSKAKTSKPWSLVTGDKVDANEVQKALDALAQTSQRSIATYDLPGPTGESNRLSLYPRGTILCLGPTPESALMQADIARNNGCRALIVTPKVAANTGISRFLQRSDLSTLHNIDAVALWSNADDLRVARKALSERDGPLIPLLVESDMAERCIFERHVCIDTTAAGGNATLLAQSGEHLKNYVCGQTDLERTPASTKTNWPA